jgi:hypothetical protein
MQKMLYAIVPDVVEMTSLSRATLFTEIARGRLQAVKCGRRTLITHDALVAYVELLQREAGERLAKEL